MHNCPVGELAVGQEKEDGGGSGESPGLGER